MISAFGPRAQACYAALGDVDAIIADQDQLFPAYLEAVRRHDRGEPFYGLVLYEESRAKTILQYASQVVTQIPDPDMRIAALDQLASGGIMLGSQRADEVWKPDRTVVKMLSEFYSLATCVLTRSYAEWGRIVQTMKRPRSLEPVVLEPQIPFVERAPSDAPALVVWGAHAPTGWHAWYLAALSEFWGNVTYVTADGAPFGGMPGRFLTVADPALRDALAGAHAIVCTDPDDPAAAIAFARRGYGIAAPFQSGAHEFVRDLVAFHYGRLRDVGFAATTAIGQPTSLRTVPAPIAKSPPRPALPERDTLPLVSTVIVTYNRPDDLDACLRCMQAQTYPNLETVVINDAGDDVSELVARYPFAQLHTMPQNGGPLRCMVESFNHIRGRYVQIIADDDIIYPDHVERLVGAMLRTGAAVAHGNTLIRYQKRTEGRLVTNGYNASVFNDSATPSEALISTPIAGQALIYRRDVFDEIGGFREDCPLADQEFQLRAAQRYVFAWVDQMTAEWRVRGRENFSAKVDSAVEMRRVFEEMHPRPDRPYLERHRAASVEQVAQRPQGFIFLPTLEFAEPAG